MALQEKASLATPQLRSIRSVLEEYHLPHMARFFWCAFLTLNHSFLGRKVAACLSLSSGEITDSDAEEYELFIITAC